MCVYICIYIYIYIYKVYIYTHILHTYMRMHLFIDLLIYFVYLLCFNLFIFPVVYPQCMLRDFQSHRPKDQLLLAPEVDVSGPAVYAMKPSVRTVGGTVDYAVLVAGVPAVPWRTW